MANGRRGRDIGLAGADTIMGPLDRLTRRSSIRRVLLVILLVALLPLGLLAAWQGGVRLQRVVDDQQARLTSAARLAVSDEQNVVSGAEHILHLLALNPAVRSGDPARCNSVLAEALQRFPSYSHFALLGADGVTRCAAIPAGVGQAVTDRALWAEMARGRFTVSAPMWGQLSNRRVLWAMLPLTDAEGRFDGVVTASIDLDYLARRIVERGARSAKLIIVTDGRGEPISTSELMPWTRLDVTGSPGTIREAAAPDGARWFYAAAPLHRARGAGESFHLVHAAKSPRRFGPEWWFSFGYFAFPVLALLLASIGIWIGANRAILRWVGALGDMAGDIGRGRYRAREESFHAAPTEIRALAAQLQRMARTIDERDRTSTAAVEEQRRLALELHHRVRNNLQIIGSFLSLQSARLPPGTARRALDQARLRVSALALVHRELYGSGELTTVSTASLFTPLADLIARQPGVEGRVPVRCSVVPLPISIDAAVPLALWAIEAAMPLGDRGQAEGGARLALDLVAADAMLQLRLSAQGLGPPPAGYSGSRLLDSIARQLSGTACASEDATSSTATLSFPAAVLSGKPHRPFTPEPGTG